MSVPLTSSTKKQAPKEGPTTTETLNARNLYNLLKQKTPPKPQSWNSQVGDLIPSIGKEMDIRYVDDATGDTLLMAALKWTTVQSTKKKRWEVIKKLLEYDAGIGERNLKTSEFPLMTMVKNIPENEIFDKESIYKTIINDLMTKALADLNEMDGDGNTALMIASEMGKAGIVKALLDNRAKTDIKNKKGETALDLAKKGKHQDVVKLLGGKPEKKTSPAKLQSEQEEERQKQEQERKRKEEEARQKQEQERKRKEEEARQKQEEEARKEKEARQKEEAKKKKEEEARQTKTQSEKKEELIELPEADPGSEFAETEPETDPGSEFAETEPETEPEPTTPRPGPEITYQDTFASLFINKASGLLGKRYLDVENRFRYDFRAMIFPDDQAVLDSSLINMLMIGKTLLNVNEKYVPWTFAKMIDTVMKESQENYKNANQLKELDEKNVTDALRLYISKFQIVPGYSDLVFKMK